MIDMESVLDIRVLKHPGKEADSLIEYGRKYSVEVLIKEF